MLPTDPGYVVLHPTVDDWWQEDAATVALREAAGRRPQRPSFDALDDALSQMQQEHDEDRVGDTPVKP